jgi:(p)ppGpp synthase/HD superfamily hydrolase
MDEGAGQAPALTERFLAAVALAEEAHGRERRSGTRVPYLAHLLVVTGLVLEDGGDEDQAIAAMLHDSVEGGGGRPLLERIRRDFGGRVAEVVEQLSDSIEPDPNESWIDRKRRYLDRLRECEDDAVLRVSLADKVNNVRAIVRGCHADGDALRERIADKTERQQLWYYGQLADLFEVKRPGPLTDDLRRTVDELNELLAEGEPCG